MNNGAMTSDEFGNSLYVLNCSDLVIDGHDRYSEHIISESVLQSRKLNKTFIINRYVFYSIAELLLENATDSEDTFVFNRAD